MPSLLVSSLAASTLCLAASGSLSLNEPAAVSPGVFNVLSINIAGLPEILNPNEESGHKRINAMYIGQKMSQYDYKVINVQEDFNYHARVYKYDSHRFRTATSGGVPLGSGLNTLSNYDWVDFARIKWNRCSDASGYDCMTRKGFTFMRLRIEQGVYIDMINLHTDAGTKPGDQVARRSNIQQVADFIDARSVGNAVIVFGDTNSRYTRSEDNIRIFTTQNNLTDAWVEAIGGKRPVAGADAILCPVGTQPDINCEVVDKVFYRGSPIIKLKSTGFFYDTSRFLSPEDEPLTDHHPVRVEFAYTLKDGLRQSDFRGGPHGIWFNDIALIPESPKLLSITIRGNNRLDGLTLTLVSGETFTHGGSGGRAHSLRLASDEYVQWVKLCWGRKKKRTQIFYAQAVTNKGGSVQAGKLTNECAKTSAPSGYGVVGSYGQAADEVNQLGFIYAEQKDSTTL
ncbi:endonuclease/exonuclease/phosphatase family protein [Rhizoctonia solani AG-3 Rhs1AP]|uniref:Endonuclease/exonuclease/phosphatase family protein n=2 Tax=Rhizoctonia solani AG-3 TaxID=1086053 RepID=A0A074S164_9AGAM|nr:endonuclease/exonuclease/phosphatase family protein [Rhizoctonia solani AG-3 Rhs1AP]KEP50643.1 endonuclease/exonuclease/phosphatase family protein [Rhizoctonia solani 123E]